MEPLSFLKDFCINLVPATSSRYVCVVGVYVLYVHCVLSVCVCVQFMCAWPGVVQSWGEEFVGEVK